MATEIDKRVVEMQFNNKEFEKNCQASLSTLEKLKMALNFDGAKGLETMAKAASKLDLSNVSKSADAIAVKFDAMNVAGMTAISELTKGFINFGKTMWNVTFGQMKSGGMARTLKIEQANFQMSALAKNVKGIGEDAAKASALVEKMVNAASVAVDGTAYGLDAAAAVASQLMASGVTDAKEMEDHLKGIAGAAAMTGRSYEDMGNIFTTVASNGKLMTMQLRQFSAAGLNLSATLANYLGKTEAQINDMVTKGQISFEQFSKALQESFSESASHADDTFNGVTSNIKAQVSRIGQLFTDPFVKHIVPLLKIVKQRIKDIRETLKPLAEMWDMVFGNWVKKATSKAENLIIARIQPIVNGITNIFASLLGFAGAIQKAFSEIFPPKTIDELQTAANIFEEFTLNLIPTEETFNGLVEMLKVFISIIKIVYNIVGAMIKTVVKPISLALLRLLGSVVRLGNAMKPFIDKLVKVVSECTILKNILTILASIVVVVIDAITQVIEAVDILLTQFAKSKSLESFASALKALANILSKLLVSSLMLVYKIISKIFSYITAENIVGFFDDLAKVAKFFIVLIDQFIASFIGMIDVIANSGTIIGDIFKLIKDVFDLIKSFITGNNTEESLNKVKDTLNELGQSIKNLFDDLFDRLKKLDAGKIMLFTFGVAIIFMVNAITKLLNSSTVLVNKASGFFGMFDSLSTAMKNFAKFNPIMQTFVGFTLAVSAVTSALVTLSSIPTDKLIASTIVLGGFTLAMIGLSVAMEYVLKKMPATEVAALNGIIANLIAISGSLLMLSVAIKLLSLTKIDIYQLANTLTALAILMADLVGSAVILSIAAKDGIQMAGGLLIFAVSVTILVSALKKLLGVDLPNVNKFLAVILSFLGIMIVFSGGLALIAAAGGTAGTGWALIGFVISLIGLVKVIKTLSEMTNDNMKAGLLRLTRLMIPIIAFLGLAAIAVKFSKSSTILAELATLVGMINVALLIMVGTMLIIGSMNGLALAKGLVSIHFMSKILAGLTKSILKSIYATKGIDYKVVVGEIRQLNKLVLALGGTMILLAAATKIISGVSREDVVFVGVLLSLLGWLTSKLVDVTKSTKDAKIGPIIAIISSLSMIMAGLAILSFADRWSLAVAGGAVALVIAALAELTKFSNAVKKVDKNNKKTDPVKNAEGIILIAAGLSMVIMSIVPLVRSMDLLSNIDIRSIGITLASLVTIVTEMVAIIALAGNINPDKAEKNSISISRIMLSMSGAVSIMSASIAGLAYLSYHLADGDALLNLAASIGSLFIVCIGLAELMARVADINNKLKDSDTKIEDLATSIVIATSALAIISASLSLLVTTMSLSGPLSLLYLLTSLVAIGGLVVTLGYVIIKIVDSMNKLPENSKLKDVSKALVYATLTIVSIASSLVILISTMKNIGWSSIPFLILSVMSLGALTIAISGVLIKIMKAMKENDFTTKQLKKVVNSMVMMSTVIAIISASLTISAVLLKNFSSIGSLWNVVGAVLLSFTVIFGEIIAVIIGIMVISKKIGTEYKDVLKEVKSLILTAVAILVAIAGVISLLAYLDIGNSEAFDKKVKALLSIFNSMAKFIDATIAILAVMSLMSKFDNSNGKIGFGGSSMSLSSISGILYSLSLMLVSFGSALMAIGGALYIVTHTISTYKPEDVEKAKKILMQFITLAGIISALAAALALIPGFGKTALISIGAISGAVLAIGLTALSFAKSVNAIVDAAEKFNNLDIDGEKFKKNFISVATGLSEGVKIMLPIFMELLLGLVAVFGLVALALAEKNALAVVAFVIACIYGIRAILPDLLQVLGEIMDIILEWLYAEDNMKKIGDFAYAIGELLSNIIIGAVKGILKTINEEVEKAIDKIVELERAQMSEGRKSVENAESKISNMEKMIDKYKEMGYAEADFGGNEKVLQKLKDEIEAYKSLESQGLLNAHWSEVYSKSINEYLSQITDESGHLLLKGIGEDKALIRSELTDTGEMIKRSLNPQEWAREIVQINSMMKREQNAGIEINREYWESYARSLGMPEEYIKYLGAEFYMKQEELLENLQNRSNQLIQQVSETKEAVVNEAENVGAEVSEAVGKGMEESTGKTTDEIKAKVKEDTNNLGDDLVEVLPNIMEKLSSGMSKVDVGSLINMDNFGDGLSSVASAIGIKAGEDLGEDFVNTVDWWIAYGEEKIITNQKEFEMSKGLSGYVKRYVKEGANSSKEYAEQQVKAHQANEKFGQSTEKAMNFLKQLFGIETETTDEIQNQITAITDNSSALTDMGNAMESVSSKTETTKSKLEEFRESVKSSITSALSGMFNDVKESEKISPEEMLFRMTKNTMDVGKWARNISILAARGMSEGLLNELREMGPEGASKVEAFVNMTDKQLSEANRRFESSAALSDYATKQIEQSYRDAGFNASLGFKNGIDKKAANTAMMELGENALDSLKEELDEHSPSRETEKIGRFATEGFVNGVTEPRSISLIRKAGNKIADILMSSISLSLSTSKLRSYGQNAIEGLVNGFKASIPTAANSIGKVAKALANIIPSEWEMHSPSKLFANYGVNAIMGLVSGVKVSEDEATDVMTRTSDDIVASMADCLKNIPELSDEDLVYRPTIQPVFDLTALDEGFSNIQNWMDQHNMNGINLSGNIRNLTPSSKEDHQDIIDAINNINNNDVVTELMNLRTDISALQESMTHLQVVMNSGALVGQIAPQMDAALAGRILRNQRGRY